MFLIVLDEGKKWKGGGHAIVKKKKLNYRFHNPNPMDVTADFLLKLLIEANAGKVERAIEEAAMKCEGGEEYIEGIEGMKGA